MLSHLSSSLFGTSDRRIGSDAKMTIMLKGPRLEAYMEMEKSKVGCWQITSRTSVSYRKAMDRKRIDLGTKREYQPWTAPSRGVEPIKYVATPESSRNLSAEFQRQRPRKIGRTHRYRYLTCLSVAWTRLSRRTMRV